MVTYVFEGDILNCFNAFKFSDDVLNFLLPEQENTFVFQVGHKTQACLFAFLMLMLTIWAQKET